MTWISSFGGHSIISYGRGPNTVHFDKSENIIITGATAYAPVDEAEYCLPPIYDTFFPYCPPPSGSSEFTQESFSDFDFNIQDIYIAIFSPDRNLRYATYLGGDRQDWVNDAFYDIENNLLYLGGGTLSRDDLPVSFPSGAYMQGNLEGQGDGLIARLFFNRSVAVNTQEVFLYNTLNVFPNPTSNKITIELPSEYRLVNVSDISIQIFNAIGQKISLPMTYNRTSTRIDLDLNSFPSGMYAYKIDNFAGQFLKIEE